MVGGPLFDLRISRILWTPIQCHNWGPMKVPFPYMWMVVEACKISSLCVSLPFLWGFPLMSLTRHQRLQLWSGLQLLSVSWRIYPSPVTGFDCWRVFRFLPGVVFFWGLLFRCSASTTLRNVDMASSMLLSSLWNLTVLLLLSPRNLLFSWVMPLSITVRSTQAFRSLYTYGNTDAKLADNDAGSTGSRYSSTHFQDGKVMFPSSSVPHDRTDAYKYCIFSEFLA